MINESDVIIVAALTVVVVPLITKLPVIVTSPTTVPPDLGKALFAVVNAELAYELAAAALDVAELACKKAAFACMKAPLAIILAALSVAVPPAKVLAKEKAAFA